MTPKLRTGIYPGTFDPITRGHLQIIRRSLQLVDRLIVGVATNPNKAPLFDLDERMAMVRADVDADPEMGERVVVKTFDTLLIEFARQNGASLIFRGLRAVSDFEYEYQMTGMNARLAPDIETVFLMASDKWQFVSSSFLKEVARLRGDISPFVSASTEQKILEALK